MKKGYINNFNDGIKLAASNYNVKIYPKEGDTIEFDCVGYDFGYVFNLINEKYSGDNNIAASKISIELIN
ncbi:hypothetical protein [Oceanobacillus sp. J11TS1]|uniref:hypothetical protein n=1 Tax=Oceanobacillus sp. J11TS1 TaxID=2807191 RepID=UPI001B1D31CF|nr:hypothetical protein [Oceanobacillus sp. J11TS1]GIO25081.1 hypothetical protein J11TS1_36620 [Oceanobacillus sp. J11TS1]